MSKWKRTQYPGVYFREHPTRRHGVASDRYYSISYRWAGKKRWEAVGWASQGIKPSRAAALLAELKENQRIGQGPVTLSEKRQRAEDERSEDKKKRAEEARLSISFQSFAEQDYFPVAELLWKPETARKHKEHCSVWLYPSIGAQAIRDIGLSDVNIIKARMIKAGRSPRTLQAVFRTFTTIWNAARDAEIVQEKAPTKHRSFKLPKVNNAVERFLTYEEEVNLFEILQEKSFQTYQMAALSVETGMRFGEVASLNWGSINLEQGVVRIMNGKGDKSRTVPLTGRAMDLLTTLEPRKNNELVFPSANGTRHLQVPKSFKVAVAESGLNDGVVDRKNRFGFHGLRHTYASRLVQAGTSLSVVQQLLGHSTPTMTARYAHLAPDDLRIGVARLEAARKAKEQGGGKLISIGQKGNPF